jgi:acyl-CoA dehydrogenase
MPTDGRAEALEGRQPMAVSLNAAGELPAELRDLRLEVRAFLQAEIASGAIRAEADAWMSGIDIGFSKRLAARGWVGMTIPVQYGGRGRSAFERYVVTEAALVKDLGTQFEGDVVVAISRHVGPDDENLGHLLSRATLHVPAFTLRGGSTEVLRGIVAKGLTSPGGATPVPPGGVSASGRQGIVSALAEAVSGVLGKDQDDWTTLAELGFTSLTVPEELGGSGGDLRDAAVVVAEAARQGSRLPLAEALFLAGEHRDTAVLADVTPARLMPLPVVAAPPGGWVHQAELLGAAARAVEIGGAARAVLDLTVTHTRDRVQFGKPLNRLQAVQQLLARLAVDVTTVTVAADASVQALASGSPAAEILVAAAKAEASALAVEIAKAGHQLHGAIGFTEEHRLGGYTKRLWSWRQELGNELYWQRRITGLIDGASGDLWPLITSTEGFTA